MKVKIFTTLFAAFAMLFSAVSFSAYDDTSLFDYEGDIPTFPEMDVSDYLFVGLVEDTLELRLNKHEKVYNPILNTTGIEFTEDIYVDVTDLDDQIQDFFEERFSRFISDEKVYGSINSTKNTGKREKDINLCGFARTNRTLEGGDGRKYGFFDVFV